ncbi:MAG: hypothetical protein E7244_21065 [Enterocloster citroniae]|nr:hypothetical protein [Enterocloster citroniae]
MMIPAGIVIAGTAVFNLFNNLHYQKKMRAAAQFLKASHVKGYITEVESMRRRAQGRFADNMLTINLSAGYYKVKHKILVL